MAIGNALGLGGLMGNGNIAAAQQSTYLTNNTSGQYRNPAMWDQVQAEREEMIRREERYRMEQKYREEIQRYGYPVPQEAMKEEAPKKKLAPVSNFPEGYEKNLLLLLEH